MRTLTWKAAPVGLHWASDNGDWAISTRVAFRDGVMILTYPDSGYVLMYKRQEVGVFKSLRAAQRAAARRDRAGMCVVRIAHGGEVQA